MNKGELQDELIDERNAYNKLLAHIREALGKLKKAEIYISHCSMTCMPINVREVDGSISQHRPRSNEGHAYDEIRDAIVTLETAISAGAQDK